MIDRHWKGIQKQKEQMNTLLIFKMKLSGKLRLLTVWRFQHAWHPPASLTQL
jgi:hypothetical protein